LPAKEFALSKVTSEWALNLDADETLSPALKEEIARVTQQTDFAGLTFLSATIF
jgi:hypothetical protein